MTELQELVERMKEKGVNGSIQERVIRLNPDYRQGQVIRGLCYEPNMKTQCMIYYGITVKDFIEEYGVEKYRSLPKECIHRFGHRKIIYRGSYG